MLLNQYAPEIEVNAKLYIVKNNCNLQLNAIIDWLTSQLKLINWKHIDCKLFN